MIGLSIGPQKGPHEVTFVPKITPKETTWEDTSLSIDPKFVVSSNSKERLIILLSFMGDGRDISINLNNQLN